MEDRGATFPNCCEERFVISWGWEVWGLLEKKLEDGEISIFDCCEDREPTIFGRLEFLILKEVLNLVWGTV